MARSRPTTRIGPVLDDLVARLEFRGRLREHAVWTVWEETVGPILAPRTEPIRIEGGKLFVRVEGSAWMQELQFLKDEIRSRLNRRVGSNVVRDLYFVLGRVEAERRDPIALPSYPVDETEIEALVPKAADPEITEALRRLARARARRLGPSQEVTARHDRPGAPEPPPREAPRSPFPTVPEPDSDPPRRG